MDLWRAADPFVIIQAFREAAKSTKSEEFLALEGAFANSPYTLIVSETYVKGVERLDSIKNELTANSKIAQLFGRMKGGIWNENFIELSNGAVLQAAGWDQELTGYNHRGIRPWRAYLDDIENRERVRDSAEVDRNWRKLWRELVPALDKIHRKLRITGTPLADDCIVRRCANDPSFVSGFFPICDGDIDDERTKSLWPERYPMTWIRSERDAYAARGLLHIFIQEYLLIPQQTQAKPFHDEDVRYAEVAPAAARFLPRKTIIDPARTVDVRTSAHTGHVTVSRMGSTILVYESGGDFWQPSEVVKFAFDSHEKFNSEVCIEKNGLDEWLMQPIRLEALKRGKAIPIRAISAPSETDKDSFITGLQPWFQAKDILLIGDRKKHSQLVAQIGNFPAGRKDVLNSLAYALKVFGGEPVYVEFGEANLVERLEPAIDAILYVAATGDATFTCAVLVAIEGQCLSVLSDWATNIPAPDSLRDIALVARASYPQHRINACVPAEVYDQAERNAIVRTLRSTGLKVFRGGYISAGRASLTPQIRTEMRGRRMLRADTRASNTIQSLTGGYQYPIGKGAKQGGEPEYGIYRFIAEAIESLTSGVVTAHQESLPDGAKTALNPQGSRYITTLPNRAARR